MKRFAPYVVVLFSFSFSSAWGRSDLYEIRSDTTDAVSFSLRVEHREIRGTRKFTFLVPGVSSLSGHVEYKQDGQLLLEAPVAASSADGYTAWQFGVQAGIEHQVVFSLGILHTMGSMSVWVFYLGDLIEAPFVQVGGTDFETPPPPFSLAEFGGKYWMLELGPERSWAPN